jgi:UMF1 family MFS transporter
VERRYGLQAWQVVAVNCVLCACVPAYGLLGLLHPALGFRRWYDMLLGVVLYGFQVGSIQSYSRAAYGAMVPAGQESRFYGLWSFVDKGSSWVGPAVVSVILQATGSIRLGFAFPLAVLLPPCAVLGCIDYRKGAEDARAFAEAWAREGGGARCRGPRGAAARGAAGSGGKVRLHSA